MLTVLDLITLQALADRIVPADDYPSAWQAGVGDYLAKQFIRDLQDAVEMYSAGLEGLEAEARVRFGASFASLSADQQDALLTHIETGTVHTIWSTDPTSFFRTVIEHVLEGYYSDPNNGGNRNAQSWKMIGYTGNTFMVYP